MIEVDCPECKGTGIVVNILWKPDGSMGPKEVDCPMCDGSGKLEQEDK